MANYREHKATGFGWWLAVSLVVLFGHDALGLSQGESLLVVGVGLVACLLGAAAPDIDLASSIPHRRFRLALLMAIAAISLGPLLGERTQGALGAARDELGLPGLPAALIAVVLALLLGLVAVALLALFLPRHRGLTHQWRFGLACAALLAGLIYLGGVSFDLQPRPTALTALAAGGYFVLGFASHLFKDGLWQRRRQRR
jgi:MFS family permease